MEPQFAQIEERYRFVLPADFREFWRRGFCTILGPGRPGPQYLLLPDMEWMPLGEIVAFKFKSYHLPGFVPFAITGAGDYWCWQPEFTQGSSTRVLLCLHDSDDADIYAPDFISAVYRQVVEGATAVMEEVEAIETSRRELAMAVSALRPFLLPARQDTLADIIQRPVQTRHPPTTRSIDWHYLIPLPECREIINRDLGADYVDSKFRWMQPSA